MNKILFKLIEGKGKFFLNGNLEYGEIVNPELVVKGGTHGILFTLDGKQIMDGDVFDSPQDILFETVYSWDFYGKGEGSKSAIRLLPEKPVQKEESQEELFDKSFREYSESLEKFIVDGIEVENYSPLEYKEYLKKYFTIKRKET